MHKFIFNENVLENYKTIKLKIFLDEQIKKLLETKNAITKTVMTDEMLYIKCCEYVEYINLIHKTQKEINEINKEKGVKTNDKSINEK